MSGVGRQMSDRVSVCVRERLWGCKFPLDGQHHFCMLLVVEALVIAVVSATGKFVFWLTLLLIVQTRVTERDGTDFNAGFYLRSA